MANSLLSVWYHSRKNFARKVVERWAELVFRSSPRIVGSDRLLDQNLVWGTDLLSGFGRLVRLGILQDLEQVQNVMYWCDIWLLKSQVITTTKHWSGRWYQNGAKDTFFFRSQAWNVWQFLHKSSQFHDSVRLDEIKLPKRIDDFFTKYFLDFLVMYDVTCSWRTVQKAVEHAVNKKPCRHKKCYLTCKHNQWIVAEIIPDKKRFTSWT